MAMRATEWVFTSPIDFRDAVTHRLHGGSFRTLPSPYVIPIALRVVFDGERNGRMLELKYLGDEPAIKGMFANEAEVEFGRKSLRPKSVFVILNETDTVTTFISKIDSALESFSRVYGDRTKSPLGNLSADRLSLTIDFIKAAIRKYQSELSKPTDVP